MKQCFSLFAAFALVGCFAIPPPGTRALECNELCAQYLTAGDLDRAEVQCDLGLQFSPQYADLYVNKGLIALRREQIDKAKELFIKALRYNQQSAQAYNNLGYLYLKDFKYGTAHDNFQAALKVNPDYTEARYNLALALKGLKQYDKARKELRTILEINPGLADPHAQLGSLALEDGANQEAIDEFTKATQLDPNYVEAWLSMGNAYMEAGKPCDGKDSYSACIEIDKDNASCRNNIVIAEKKCGLQDKALEDVKARAAGLKSPEGEYTLALQMHDKGLVNDEERAYKRCLRYDPKYPQCHYGLFEIFKNRSDEKNATIACKNFLKFAAEVDFRAQMQTCQQYVRD
jgi:Tfp pilus assembly protein PilF